MRGTPSYPASRVDDVEEIIHGVPVQDPYRWLERGGDPEVRQWEERQREVTRLALSPLPARARLRDQLERLWRYDDETPPRPCLTSDRLFYQRRRAEQDKWVLYMQEGPGAKGRLVVDPNTWDAVETLDYWAPSPDGRYLALGRARAGDEATRVVVLDVDTGEELGDTLAGWRQAGVAWLHDNSGFYYSAKPLPGAVPAGQHHYWHRVWFHRLGTQASEDRVVFASDTVKEQYHAADVSQDGRWLMLYRISFDKQQLYLKDLEGEGEAIPLMDALDAQYNANVVDGQLVVCTDWGAPRRRVLSAPIETPQREHWREIVPQHPRDTLSDVDPIDGRLYLTWMHDATSRITVHDLGGSLLGQLRLPALGTASVWGSWRHPEVWVSFQSFNHAPSVYTFDFDTQRLELYREHPIALNTSDIEVEQVWYPSADGTRVSMFLAYRRGARERGPIPFLMYGYGGFNLSKMPTFSSTFALWVKSGGGLALPNLRGGGEYGQGWHEAGMRERKQNVFDDAISAAEWLIAEGWTTPELLTAMGGSNGGLLVGALAVQRPDLFKAMVCQVPLLDMVRYHRFGLANIWAQEYGSADEPGMFPYLLAYSPYHNVRDGVAYPAMLISGSENDARTDPLHARKFGARLQAASAGGGPILVDVQRASGHHGAVSIGERAAHTADAFGFLMSQVGLTPRV